MITNILKKSRNRKLFVLLGSHRSGTSLAARILNHIGLPMGDDLIPGHGDNPEGFWEHRKILAETKAVEDKLGLNPFTGEHLLPSSDDWWNDDSLDQHIRNLGAILKQELKNNEIFGFKDPRTLLLLPFWKKIFENENIEPVYVFLMRDPAAVAASIARRQNLSPEHGEYIWTSHWCYAVSHLPEPPRAVLNYEDWFSHPDQQVQAILGLLDNYAVSPDKATEIVRSIANPELSHRSKSGKTLNLNKSTIDLYKQLSEKSGGMDWSETRRIANDFLESNRIFNSVYESIAARASRIDNHLKDCQEKVTEAMEQNRKILATISVGEDNDNSVMAVEPRPALPLELDFPDLTGFIHSHSAEGPGKKLRICIATEDIVGPIRNGGIGTTYTHLAKLLSKAGHDVHILYLKGDYCENKSIEYWVDYYKQFDINFIAFNLDNYQIVCPASRWLQPMYAMYEFLKKEHFDLVHVSEWHGSGYLSLAAKKQGLAFRNTLFCVKTSSPWLWNREYGFHTIGDLHDLPKMYAEKRSVELADIVIGGSRDLLCWMVEHGYKLPEKHTYVQPNVMIPLDIDDLADKRRKLYGSRTEVKEIVFFGRLEYRKGLDIFFDALEILLNEGVELPKIYLMGKYGERIPSHPELTIPEYIKERSKKWPVSIEILNNYNNEEALRFLLSDARLAVMPSVIENSSLAVYEAANYGIPFIASDRGGTSELVQDIHRKDVLVDAHPIPLSEKIKEALAKGGFIARPSFNNERNLAVWLKFHSTVGNFIDSNQGQNSNHKPTVSVCLVVSDDHDYANEVIRGIAHEAQNQDTELIVVNNGSTKPETVNWLEGIEKTYGEVVTVANLKGWGEQHAQNYAAELANGDLIVFPRSGTILKENYLDIVRTAAANSEADIFCCFYDEITYDDFKAGRPGTSIRHAIIAEDYSYGFYDHENLSPVIAIRRNAFKETSGFNEMYKVPGADLELLSQAHLSNLYITTIPEAIALYIKDFPGEKRLNYKALPYRSIRPYLQLAPQCYSRILLTARGVARPTRGPFSEAFSSAVSSDSDDEARNLSSKLGNNPRLRNLGLSAYNRQIRLFQQIIHLEITTMRKMLAAWKWLRTIHKPGQGNP